MRMRTIQGTISRFSLIFGLISIISGYTAALEVPPLTGRVNDEAKLLSSATVTRMESYLSAVEQTGNAQIALLTISSLEGDSLEAYSIRVVEKWRLGQSGKDNGVLFLVAVAEKKIRIEVGYGLEGVLTDAVSGYIIRTVIVPEFQKGQFDAGIIKGIQAVGGVVTGETPISQNQIRKSGSGKNSGSSSLFFLIFLIIFLLTRMGGYRHHRQRGMSHGTAFMMGLFSGSLMRHRGSGFSGDSGGFGGGGFSGGGGGFGGGGASGGW